MPIYEYECEKCSFKFELLRTIKEDGGAPCPKCQGHSRRILSPISYIWKGTRFAGENMGKKESSKPKEQSVNAENDKKPENGKKNDKPAPPTTQDSKLKAKASEAE